MLLLPPFYIERASGHFVQGRSIKCCKERKITAPRNVCRNISFNQLVPPYSSKIVKINVPKSLFLGVLSSLRRVCPIFFGLLFDSFGETFFGVLLAPFLGVLIGVLSDLTGVLTFFRGVLIPDFATFLLVVSFFDMSRFLGERRIVSPSNVKLRRAAFFIGVRPLEEKKNMTVKNQF